MKNTVLATSLVALLSWQGAALNAAQIQWSLSDFDQPESALYNPVSKEILVSNINGSPVEMNGKGYISRVSSDGKMLEKHWVEGMDAPKGMALFGEMLYIADMQKLHAVNSKTGELVKSYLANNSKMLNDVSADAAGNIYVSDLLGGGIYRLQGDTFELWLKGDNIAHPNGLLVEKNNLYIASWGQGMHEDFSTDLLGKVYQLPLNNVNQPLQSISNELGNLDGIVRFNGDLIVNDWINGKVFKLKNGKAEQLFNAGKAASDIGLYQDKLLVPVMFDNRLDVYKLN